jgi:hypothetical protein
MARQRASAARDAFGRVNRVTLPPADDVSASENDGANAVIDDGATASITAGYPDSVNDSVNAGPAVSRPASRTVDRKAAGKTGKKAGRTARRAGRPRGPERVPLTIRILAQNDARLTAAVETTGDSPQYIVDAALTAYFDALGIPATRNEAQVR